VDEESVKIAMTKFVYICQPEAIKRKLRIRFIFSKSDIWIGAFWDRRKNRLYIFPFPCIGIIIYTRRIVSV